MKAVGEIKTYVQYGSGNEAVAGWLNYDASPTLRIQKIPVLGRLLRSKLNCVFDNEVLYGDIVNGLPLLPESVDVVFCSHVLEHLSLCDFHVALDNTYLILKKGGGFRCVVPDLEFYAKKYIKSLAGDDTKASASIDFIAKTCLGDHKRKHGVVARLIDVFGNSSHRWMWDRHSLSKALLDHNFSAVREFTKNQSTDALLVLPERDHQFIGSIGLECIKP